MEHVSFNMINLSGTDFIHSGKLTWLKTIESVKLDKKMSSFICKCCLVGYFVSYAVPFTLVSKYITNTKT